MFPELKVCSSLEELAYTFGVIDTRKLNQDAAGCLQWLDVGLGNTKAVDTGADDVERVLDGCVSFFAQYA
jgi:hypothetical protein